MGLGIRALIALLSDALRAIAALAKAAIPVMAWRVTGEIENINDQIIHYESLNTVDGRRAADVLRSKRQYRIQLHDSLLAALPKAQEGPTSPDK